MIKNRVNKQESFRLVIYSRQLLNQRTTDTQQSEQTFAKDNAYNPAHDSGN